MSDGYTAQQGTGLLVPTATLMKTQRTLPFQVLRRFERFMAGAKRDHGLLALWHCERCRQIARLFRRNQIVESVGDTPAPGGDVTFVCDCTVWTVR